MLSFLAWCYSHSPSSNASVWGGGGALPRLHHGWPIEASLLRSSSHSSCHHLFGPIPLVRPTPVSWWSLHKGMLQSIIECLPHRNLTRLAVQQHRVRIQQAICPMQLCPRGNVWICRSCLAVVQVVWPGQQKMRRSQVATREQAQQGQWTILEERSTDRPGERDRRRVDHQRLRETGLCERGRERVD